MALCTLTYSACVLYLPLSSKLAQVAMMVLMPSSGMAAAAARYPGVVPPAEIPYVIGCIVLQNALCFNSLLVARQRAEHEVEAVRYLRHALQLWSVLIVAVFGVMTSWAMLHDVRQLALAHEKAAGAHEKATAGAHERAAAGAHEKAAAATQGTPCRAAASVAAAFLPCVLLGESPGCLAWGYTRASGITSGLLRLVITLWLRRSLGDSDGTLQAYPPAYNTFGAALFINSYYVIMMAVLLTPQRRLRISEAVCAAIQRVRRQTVGCAPAGDEPAAGSAVALGRAPPRSTKAGEPAEEALGPAEEAFEPAEEAEDRTVAGFKAVADWGIKAVPTALASHIPAFALGFACASYLFLAVEPARRPPPPCLNYSAGG